MQNTEALTAKTAAATDEQILDSFLALSLMDWTERPAGFGPALVAIEAEIARRPHLAAEVAAINAELDAAADVEIEAA